MSAIEEVGLDLVADWKKLTEQEYEDQFKNMSMIPTVSEYIKVFLVTELIMFLTFLSLISGLL